MKLRITPVFPVKRFAAVSAQNVKNVQFDYTNMPTYKMCIRDRADSLRFWDFINCSAASLGSEIRGIHGQRVTTDCPAPPIHAQDVYKRQGRCCLGC